MLLVLLLCVIITILLLVPTKEEPMEYSSYTVKSGDTLWSIALRESNGGGKMDTRDIIDDILQESNVSDNIIPGDVLYVPQYGGE